MSQSGIEGVARAKRWKTRIAFNARWYFLGPIGGVIYAPVEVVFGWILQFLIYLLRFNWGMRRYFLTLNWNAISFLLFLSFRTFIIVIYFNLSLINNLFLQKNLSWIMLRFWKRSRIFVFRRCPVQSNFNQIFIF